MIRTAKQMRQGLEAVSATGAELLGPYLRAILAEACGKAGQVPEGLRQLAEAMVMMHKHEGRWCAAELYRLKGELLLKTGRDRQHAESTPEACFLQALDTAHQQQAKSWELRAAMSLSRLWQRHGKAEEARRLLAKIYGQFTEGFDTADLQDAKALLEEMA